MKAISLKQKNKLAYLPQTNQPAGLLKHALTVFIALFFIYVAVLFAGQYWRLLQLRGTLTHLHVQIAAVRSDNEEMRAEVLRLQSPDYLEQIAREELGMVRSGELLFYFQGRDNLETE